MYVDTTPLDVKKFEKEHSRSFLDLFYPSLYNVVSLIALIKRIHPDEALPVLYSMLEEQTLFNIFETIVVEMELLGFVSFLESDGVEDTDDSTNKGVATFYEIWDEGFVEAVQLNISPTDYWYLPPKVILELCSRRIEEIKREKQDEMFKMDYQSKLIALAYHSPKNLPKNPPELFPKERKEQSLEEQAEIMMRMKNRYKKPRQDSVDDEIL